MVTRKGEVNLFSIGWKNVLKPHVRFCNWSKRRRKKIEVVFATETKTSTLRFRGTKLTFKEYTEKEKYDDDEMFLLYLDNMLMQYRRQ